MKAKPTYIKRTNFPTLCNDNSFCYPGIAFPEGCPDLYPQHATVPSPGSDILKGETLQYNTVSDGIRRNYTDEDELIEYGRVGILDPDTVSYTNLFVNGVLQPSLLYEIREGLLVLKSIDVPTAGVPINLQFVLIRG